jgi:hypothetical protein
MLRIAMELPHSSMICGGIRDNLLIAERFDPQMFVRFQSLRLGYPHISMDWTVGMPDTTFPECDAVITYADNPHTQTLVNLPQIKKKYILMLSYGMSIIHERRNIHIPGLTVLCSSKKIERAIRGENVKVHRLGLGFEMSAFRNNNEPRKRYLAILYHDMVSKRYETSVKVSDMLFKAGIIDGVISFGRHEGYDNAPKPLGLVKHYLDATADQVCEVFNRCMCFLMPSTTEGINLTPIESALCGCPSVLVDGAIGEVFFDNQNCRIVHKEKIQDMFTMVKDILDNYDTVSAKYQAHMTETIKDMTWDSVLTKLREILYA